MADGFLGRWSRRKLDAKEGRPVEPEPPRELAPEPVPQPAADRATPVAAATPADPPPPTLDDVKALTPQSDFSRFTAPNVAPEVKNAAMKKLFADPRFNIQDGLDVYIDDYSKPDPIPAAMLRQLASAKFLGLFRDEERKDVAPVPPPGDHADRAAPQSVAQSTAPQDGAPPAPTPASQPADHADPDLRLQQDHAPPGPAPGGGAG